MIESGKDAPSFTLPAVADGKIVDLDLGSFLGEEVVILAFYPGDFNPACSDAETGLDELDLFTMQKDVQVLAISGDSVYSHDPFGDQYNLHMPLLSDTDGTVATAYGVGVDDERAGHLAKRAVIVVDHTGAVQYTWASEKPGHVPRAEEIRSAIEEIGDGETAESRYRVGYAHYIEGRRAFTSAMKAYESREWMMAQTDFTQAGEEFDEAGEEFNTAVRFAESEKTQTSFERAEQKSESLWRAADWLAESASAFASGEGAKAESLREDAEAPLETARELHEPPKPDEFPPEEDPADRDDDEPIHPLADDDESATLDAEINDQLSEAGAENESLTDSAEQSAQAVADDQADQPAESGDQPAAASDTTTAQSQPDSGEATEASTDTETAAEIDDEELEEITAELEEQTEASELSDPEPDGEEIPEEAGIVRDDADGESEELEADDDVELELTDPTEDEEDEPPDDDDTSDHSVPDSL